MHPKSMHLRQCVYEVLKHRLPISRWYDDCIDVGIIEQHEYDTVHCLDYMCRVGRSIWPPKL